jgi:GNAT superfamily N-acetyltransferase
VAGDDVRIVPANEASWSDLSCVFEGVKRHGTPCFCQRFKISDRDWASVAADERAHRLREQTDCGHADSDTTTGLVAFVDGEPAGWCAIEPRRELVTLRSSRLPWAGRDEDRDDPAVWAVTCIIVRRPHRGRHLTYDLVAAAVDHARSCGAGVIEGYPMITHPDQEITWGELSVGARGAFVAAGFEEVAHPTKRRVVMRRELGPPPAAGA